MMIYMEKKAQAEKLLQRFPMKERMPFHFKIGETLEYPNGAVATWYLFIHLFGVLLHFLELEKEQGEEASKMKRIYEETNLPILFNLNRPITQTDLQEAFDEQFTPEFVASMKDNLRFLKNADEVFFYTDEAEQANFQLL